MTRGPTLLLILAVPAGIIGYALGAWVISALPLADGVQDALALFVPLLVAGLCMLPFIIPTFDRMAKRDLAAHREAEAAEVAARERPADDSSGTRPR